MVEQRSKKVSRTRFAIFIFFHHHHLSVEISGCLSRVVTELSSSIEPKPNRTNTALMRIIYLLLLSFFAVSFKFHFGLFSPSQIFCGFIFPVWVCASVSQVPLSILSITRALTTDTLEGVKKSLSFYFIRNFFFFLPARVSLPFFQLINFWHCFWCLQITWVGVVIIVITIMIIEWNVKTRDFRLPHEPLVVCRWEIKDPDGMRMRWVNCMWMGIECAVDVDDVIVSGTNIHDD